MHLVMIGGSDAGNEIRPIRDEIRDRVANLIEKLASNH